VGEQQSLFVFACFFAKINVLCLGIAKMVLKKPTCAGDCNDFVCFGVALTCEANKLIAICDSRSAPLSRRKKCVGKKKQKIFLGLVFESARSRDVKLYLPFVFVKTLCLLSTDVDGRITYNGLQLQEVGDFGALNCLPELNLIRSTKILLTTEPPISCRCC
jgi:hypothetical protein